MRGTLSCEHALALTCNKAAPSNPREIHLHGEEGGQRDLLLRKEAESLAISRMLNAALSRVASTDRRREYLLYFLYVFLALFFIILVEMH